MKDCKRMQTETTTDIEEFIRWCFEGTIKVRKQDKCTFN